MKPLNNYVILKPLREEVKIAGMDLPEELKKGDRYGLAEVTGIPDGCDLVKEGDRVYYERSGAFSLSINSGQVTVSTLQKIVLIV